MPGAQPGVEIAGQEQLRWMLISVFELVVGRHQIALLLPHRDYKTLHRP